MQVSYYFQLAQQHQQSLQNNSSAAPQPQQQQQQQQLAGQQQVQVQSGVQTITVNQQQQQSQPQVSHLKQGIKCWTKIFETEIFSVQVIQLQPQQMNQSNTAQPPPGGIQIVQQIIGPNGEIQQIPILLNEQQLSLIRSQMIGGTNQPIVIQTAPIQAQAQPVTQTQPIQQVYIQQE